VVFRNRTELAFALAAAQDVAVEAPQDEVESIMSVSATRAGPSSLHGGMTRHRAALFETAGLKLMKNLPLRFFDLRG